MYGVLTVRGNHDRELLTGVGGDGPTLSDAARAYLATLPATRAFDTPRGPALLCHGLGEDDVCRLFPEDDDATVMDRVRRDPLIAAGGYRFVVGGHTHVPMYRPLPDGPPVLINAGTLHWGYECGFVVCEFDLGLFRFFTLDHDAGFAVRPGPVHCLPEGFGQ
jgi:predicted phosphodiesterase